MLKDVADLKKYLEARRGMAENNKNATYNKTQKDISHAAGMVFAFDEAIKAVEALQDTGVVCEACGKKLSERAKETTTSNPNT